VTFVQVVRRPVVVAGNSIGGFISASLAADYPGLVQGLVLLNSAGGCVAAVWDGAAAQRSWGQGRGL
jgi:pimeloyl-ACP methyl ester carboxylesterase